MKKCFFCNNVNAVYHITELKNGKALDVFSVCEKCGTEYIKNSETDKSTDISNIATPEQLLALIDQMGKSEFTKPPCGRCGLTIKEFQIKGKFGCPDCYDHFGEEFEALVVPWHMANEHTGKIPKNRKHQEENEEDKIKTLKLQLAKASEIENYELAAILKKKLDFLTSP
jgi:protein arginine kinase activator